MIAKRRQTIVRSMQRNLEDQPNNLKPFILLSPIPPRLRYLSTDRNWKPIRDEIRRLAHIHKLAEIPERAFKVAIWVGHAHLFATCDFKEESDAHDLFELTQGHRFEGLVLQAWLIQPGHGGYKVLNGPEDQDTGSVLRPPVPNPPTVAPTAVPRASQPRNSRGPFRSRSNHTGSRTHDMVVHRTERSPIVSQGCVLLPSLPAATVPTHESPNNVDLLLAPHSSPFAMHLDLDQQHLGRFSFSVGDASDLSDSHHTSELSSSSRTSSVSAIPDAYLPGNNSNYGTFHFIAGSSYPNHNSSVSNASNTYTPAHSRNQSGSSHTPQDTASDEACKVIIWHVRAGVTHEQLSELLDQKMRSYVQHETPRRGEENEWSIKFSKEEDAKKAQELLHNSDFMEQKLRVHLTNGGPRRQINGNYSNTSETFPSITPGPIIIDGSIAS